MTFRQLKTNLRLRRRTAAWIILLSVLTVLCGLGGSTSYAQNKQRPLRLKLEPLSIRGRSASALPIQIKLEYNEAQLLEGDLLLEVYNSVQTPEDLIATIRYEGIVLQGNDYIFNTVLPPIEHSHNKQYLIVGWFDTASGRMSLSRDLDDPEEAHELLSIGDFERATLLCSVSGHRDYLRTTGNRAFLNQALSLENYDPGPQNSVPIQHNADGGRFADTQRIQHFSCPWDAHLLPEDPLQLTCFDVVLLADGALGRLEAGQLEALKTWIAAGGSLCVLPDGTRLTGIHLNFLQTLVNQGSGPDLQLSITDEGTLLTISTQDTPVIKTFYGLGRVCLLPNVPDVSAVLHDEILGQVVAHLWKARKDSGIASGQKWQKRTARSILEERRYQIIEDANQIMVRDTSGTHHSTQQARRSDLEDVAAHYGLQYELQPGSNPLMTACEEALMPQDVKMVPTSIIALLLIAYVVTIGPIDYLVLGFFRARKYTWIMFPIVTAAFTLLTVSIAHSYMASTETGSGLTITDVAEDGTPIRSTTLQMHFHASRTRFTSEATRSFMVPAQSMAQSFQRRVDYSGRFPQTYQIQQNMRQWEPVINRTMLFQPEMPDVPKIPWEDASLVTTAAGRSQLAELLKTIAEEPSETAIDAVILNGKQQIPVGVHRFLFSADAIRRGQEWNNMEPWQKQYDYPPTDSLMAIGVLQASARTGTRDFFSIVSQVSPQGSASMEDLPVLDSSDPTQWLLIVALRSSDQTNIYRRLYHTSNTEESLPANSESR